MSNEPYYITTPIYYVNDKPHIGHAYTTILADVLARYHRLRDDPTWFLTGTDEHGQKVAQAAEKGGMTPKQQADTTVVRFQELWEKFDISHDDFIRTTEDRHSRIVQKLLQQLFDKGEIYKEEYSGWYCVGEERFYTEKDLVDGKSPDTGAPVEFITESNYFFKMGQYRDWLIQHIDENPEFIQPSFRKNETLGFLKQELNDLCISRPKERLSWGIELPFDSEFVTYVWFDALVNYISAVGCGSDEEQFNKWWPASCHLIGKDILTTHTVYWPTMLKAMGLPMPKMIFAHGWWLSGATKMSKSLGNVVNPMDYAENYGVDAFRYFLIAEMTLGQDASFTHDVFTRRYNAELANDLGNLASRVLKMLKSNLGGVLPHVAETDWDAPERSVWAAAQTAVTAMSDHVDTMRLDLGIAAAITAVRETNKYLENRKPWLQAKEEDKRPLEITLYTAAEILRVVSALLFPVMPEKMAELRRALGMTNVEPHLKSLKVWGGLAAGSQSYPILLFPRIQEESKKRRSKASPKRTQEQS